MKELTSSNSQSWNGLENSTSHKLIVPRKRRCSATIASGIQANRNRSGNLCFNGKSPHHISALIRVPSPTLKVRYFEEQSHRALICLEWNPWDQQHIQLRGGGSPTEVGPVSPRSTANTDNRLPKDSLLYLRITLLNQ